MATTATGRQLSINQKTIEEFKKGFRGEVITPESPGYDAARAVYNAMIDRRPAMIARCANVADVIRAVRFANERGVLVAIRGGGHNGAGLGVCDGGLVIDLSPMRGVRVNPANRTVRVEGGCTWGLVDHATHAFGLATVSGVISTTGVAGLTLGGGHGYLTRKHGLTIDNLLAADVILADGTFLTASLEQNQDLFWALRGGGGNFGVVTSFLLQAHPVKEIIGGPILWPLEQTREVLGWYREFSPAAPEDLYGFIAFMTVPPAQPFPESLHGKKMCGSIWCYTGAPENAKDAFKPVQDFGPPAFFGVHPMPYPVLQSAFDRFYPHGLQWYWKGDFFNEISDGAIDVHLEYSRQLPTPLSSVHLYPIDGAPNRIGATETAFSYRESRWSGVITGVDPDPANRDHITKWTREYWEALHPYSAGGAYSNFMMEEGQDRVQAAYRGNYARLADIKAKYDPANLFRVNQNIHPAG